MMVVESGLRVVVGGFVGGEARSDGDGADHEVKEEEKDGRG